MDGKVMSYIIEWCDTPSKRQAGVAYKNMTVLYDMTPGEHVRLVWNSPSNNMYVRIPFPLPDAVDADGFQILTTFLSQTFWCNQHVLRCNQAALALAKRGLNIDRCFIGLSPGGVGQSLYTSLLSAALGDAHSYFDPSIFYLDEELRKQVENFVGCYAITGQECPETNKRLREDLFKKLCSGDRLLGRKPYGLTTRMFELKGWKRMEVNHMLSFQGVTEDNFESILRRSLVWTPHARFMDKTYLENHYPDSHLDGIFPKTCIARATHKRSSHCGLPQDTTWI